MNKKLITGIAAIIVVFIVLFILSGDRSPFGKNNSSFAVEPQSEITGIEFSQAGKKLVLEKHDHNWFMNGGIETRKSGINFIIRILHDIEIKSPVSDELFDKEMSNDENEPVKVRIFKKRKLLKTFLVYKTRSNIYGNIMKMKERSKAFIVHVPGFEGDIGSAFTLNELFWQPYTIFNLLPSEIASVHFENFSDTSASFVIFNNKNEFMLSDMNRFLKGWDPSLVTRYLSYFARIPFESWAIEMKEDEKERVKSQNPLCRITLKASDSDEIILTLWEKVIDENGKFSIDKDRLYGKTENSDEIFLVRYFDIDPILKKKSYFFHE